ncbi:MAG: hypothetical protein M3Y87_29680 [Myxococcota bacterium]|nr:hypothetical protein [Myxococcota bacterium]
MIRFLLVALALATLGLSGPAAAEDCLCVGPEQVFADVAASVTLESPDPLAPLPELEAAPAPSERAAAPVLWCVSPDDPRCSRDDTGEAPHRITLATSPVAAIPTTPRVPPPAITLVDLATETLPPSDGISGSLDRPPRA